MSPFMDGKPRVVTEADLRTPWGGVGREKFRCYICGTLFQLGDYWRWQYVENRSNIMVCKQCDGPDLVERWAKMFDNAMHVGRVLDWFH